MESAREEARLYCDELAADDIVGTLSAHAALEYVADDYDDADSDYDTMIG